MKERSSIPQVARPVLSNAATLVALSILVMLFAIALVSSDEAQRVFATFLVLAALGFATRTRKYSTRR